MPQEDAEAKKSFAKLMDEHFPILMDEYLKDTQFCYSDKVTIAGKSAFVLFYRVYACVQYNVSVIDWFI